MDEGMSPRRQAERRGRGIACEDCGQVWASKAQVDPACRGYTVYVVVDQSTVSGWNYDRQRDEGPRWAS